MIERKFVSEGIKRSELDAHFKKILKRAGYIGVDTQKTPVVTRVILFVERPGLVIGKKGSTIQRITRNLEKEFKMENVQIKVEEVKVPELSAVIMANRIANSLERGLNFRRVLGWTLDKIMKAGALGTEIVVSGKLVGKGGKSRTQRTSAGYIKKAGDTARFVDIGRAQAIKKAGIIGVTVKIVPPNVVFPDKVAIVKKEEKPEGGEHGDIESKADAGIEQRRANPKAARAKK